MKVFIVYTKPTAPSGWATEDDIARLFRKFKIIGARLTRQAARELASKHPGSLIKAVDSE